MTITSLTLRWSSRARRAWRSPAVTRGIASLTLAMTLFVLSSCGLVDGGAPTSTGDPNISGEIGSVTITAPEGTAGYKAIPITNSQSGPVQITNIIFDNNLCGDFSLYSIVDAAGLVLYQAGGLLQAVVPGGGSINLVLKYQPTMSCIHTDYDTTLYVYYSDGIASRRISLILKPVISAPLPEEEDEEEEEEDEEEDVECAEDPASFTYEPLNIAGKPAAGEYFLEITRMRSFIFTSLVKSVVGTDINVANFPEGTEYTPTHIKAIVADDGGITLSPITVCDNFQVPSATNDSNFFGSPSVVTSKREFSGTIDGAGVVNLTALEVQLRVEDLNTTPSLIDNVDGVFQVTIQSDITTGETVEDFNLGPPLLGAEATIEFEGEHVLPISDADGDSQFLMTGSAIQEGKIVLVGRGVFLETDFIGDMLTAFPILTDETSFIYLELDATFTTRSGGGEEGEGEGI